MSRNTAIVLTLALIILPTWAGAMLSIYLDHESKAKCATATKP